MIESKLFWFSLDCLFFFTVWRTYKILKNKQRVLCKIPHLLKYVVFTVIVLSVSTIHSFTTNPREIGMIIHWVLFVITLSFTIGDYFLKFFYAGTSKYKILSKIDLLGVGFSVFVSIWMFAVGVRLMGVGAVLLIIALKMYRSNIGALFDTPRFGEGILCLTMLILLALHFPMAVLGRDGVLVANITFFGCLILYIFFFNYVQRKLSFIGRELKLARYFFLFIFTFGVTTFLWHLIADIDMAVKEEDLLATDVNDIAGAQSECISSSDNASHTSDGSSQIFDKEQGIASYDSSPILNETGTNIIDNNFSVMSNSSNMQAYMKGDGTIQSVMVNAAGDTTTISDLSGGLITCLNDGTILNSLGIADGRIDMSNMNNIKIFDANNQLAFTMEDNVIFDKLHQVAYTIQSGALFDSDHKLVAKLIS